MNLMVNRVDSWSHQEDTILIEAVMENARNNNPKMQAYHTASERLKDRTPGACSGRWGQIRGKVINNPSLEIEEVVKIADPTPSSQDYIDTLINGGVRKEELKLVGVYLEPDVANGLDWLGKKGGRGAKSRVVNELLKAAFIEKGLLSEALPQAINRLNMPNEVGAERNISHDQTKNPFNDRQTHHRRQTHQP